MIEGFVNADYEPVISIPMQGSSGQEREIEAVVDTGYNGYLSIAQLLVGPRQLLTNTSAAIFCRLVICRRAMFSANGWYSS